MLEIVRAFDWIIQAGKAFYWATSEWSLEQIEEAYRKVWSLPSVERILTQAIIEIAEKYNLHAPVRFSRSIRDEDYI